MDMCCVELGNVVTLVSLNGERLSLNTLYSYLLTGQCQLFSKY